MIPKAPQIGFDRFVQLDWVAAVLRVRSGQSTDDELTSLLGANGLGREAMIKTRTKLNALALEPRADLVDFINRGVHLFHNARASVAVAPYAWGAALATYPYFGRVAEFTGRLTALQGDCSVAEIHRRISEVYGDREVTKRATQAVLQSQANWGAIERIDGNRRLRRLVPIVISDRQVIAWLLEAALRYQGRALAIATLQSAAVLYPFELDQPLAYVISNAAELEFRSEGANQQFVALKSGTWVCPRSS